MEKDGRSPFLIIEGKDNFGKPRQNYALRIAAMDDAAFEQEVQQALWLSVYAKNNPRSDYHWQARACLDETNRRAAHAKAGAG